MELGGGSTPLNIPNLQVTNVDTRQIEGVDIVRDLNKDFSDIGKFDGLYSSYLAEHIGWRNIQLFFESCFNILNEGSMAVFIVPDTLEQMRLILDKSEVSLEDSRFLFGDQDYPENSHKVLFSKRLLETLLRAAGFEKVTVQFHPDPKARDLIVTAVKGASLLPVPSADYERRYFEETYVGGYRDFPVHYRTAQDILKRKPQSVIEFGGARGYIGKILKAYGLPIYLCVDISEHCYHTRATDRFVIHDLTKGKLGLGDKEFDLAFSIAFLEHLSTDKLDEAIKETMRLSKRGLHGITFTITPEDIDPTHRSGTIKPKTWWIEKFRGIDPNYPVEILNKEELEAPPIPLPPEDDLVKIQFGSWTNMFHYGWRNGDIADLTPFAQAYGYKFEVIDVAKPLPYQSNAVDLIVAHHLIEHLKRGDGRSFLAECLRILRPRGVIRLSAPDPRLLFSLFDKRELIDTFKPVSIEVEKAEDEADALWRILYAGHETLYDAEGLAAAMRQTGFSEVAIMPFNSSRSVKIQSETIDSYPTLSFYVEGEKPEDLSNSLYLYQHYLAGELTGGRQ